MSTAHFRWTIICLFVVALGMLGFLSFQTWNQKVDHGGRMARDGSSQLDLGSGEEASENKADSKRSDDTSGPRKGHTDVDKGGKAESKAGESTHSYEVDAAASRVFVKVGSATRIGHPHGVEGKLKSGKITLGAGGELVFDMKSFKADTEEARKKVGLESKKVSDNEAKKVSETMQSADVLDVQKFPTGVYKIIAIKPAEKQEAGAPGLYQASGRFTLHGAEQPLQFKAKLEPTDKKGVFRLSGSFTIKQTAYGMTPYSAAGGLAKVADELEIVGELVLGSPK
jgi:polyisoprenoid-binding protein YceI